MFWQRTADAERRRTGSAAETEAAIRSLSPVYEVTEPTAGPASPWAVDATTGRLVLAAGRPRASAGSETPLVDELDRAIFGP